MYNNKNDIIEYRVIKHIGTLTTYQTGWTKEVNIVSWNGGTPKIDIRDWSLEHDRMTRGITMFEEEAAKLVEVLADYFTAANRKEA